MLKPEGGGEELIERIDKRITALSFHIQNYYLLDFTQLNNIYCYRTEEYSHTAINKFNVIPESIPDLVFDFMPLQGGYFIGNVSPARMDFRWFLVGNCIAILSSLATPAQATAIMDLIEERWEDLIGEMPLKITYPALEGHQWRIVIGCDPKNTRWSYHNGGTWPGRVWCAGQNKCKFAQVLDLKGALMMAIIGGNIGRKIEYNHDIISEEPVRDHLAVGSIINDYAHLLLVATNNESIFMAKIWCGSGKRSKRASKGHFVVYVGDHRGGDDDQDVMKRFEVPTSYLKNPIFKQLLEKAAEEYGFHSEKGIVLPCSESSFQQHLDFIAKRS
ncbi:putative alkaline/neutral invertase D [Camellia lanceoleosa]|uniref:Alkaline/neutral invertase D n=1 Tax=Camellia lanceoleosa TaxID=1840588 RepID=A0ACC0IQV4_9ERIC|nr:putative alkaline/neutral invertase D [Camellia lanceoleosa]